MKRVALSASSTHVYQCHNSHNICCGVCASMLCSHLLLRRGCATASSALPKFNANDWPRVLEVPTRIADNDMQGHVNNTNYYAFMDTAICRMFDEIDGSFEHPRFVAETSMKFLSPTSYPETITVGIGVSKLGTSSVIYKVGMFGKSTGRQLSLGKFVHVYVDKNNHRPTPIPNSHKSVMLGMMMPG